MILTLYYLSRNSKGTNTCLSSFMKDLPSFRAIIFQRFGEGRPRKKYSLFWPEVVTSARTSLNSESDFGSYVFLYFYVSEMFLKHCQWPTCFTDISQLQRFTHLCSSCVFCYPNSHEENICNVLWCPIRLMCGFSIHEWILSSGGCQKNVHI